LRCWPDYAPWALFYSEYGWTALFGRYFVLYVIDVSYDLWCCLDGLNEEEAKIGAAGLVMAIVGGAVMPGLQGVIIDAGGTAVDDTIIIGVTEVNFSFVLPLICFAFIAFYGNRVYKVFMAKPVG